MTQNNSITSDLIPSNRAELIRFCYESNLFELRLDDDDQFPLGGGLLATYSRKRSSFAVTRGDTLLGEVCLDDILDRPRQPSCFQDI